MNYDSYAALDGVRASLLNKFRRTPAHVKHELDTGGNETAALELGWLLHIAVLEPKRFKTDVVVAPKIDKRTKIGKETWAAFCDRHADHHVVTVEQLEAVEGMKKSLYQHVTAGALLRSAKGMNEVTITWEEKVGGEQVPCKARLDRIVQLGEWPMVCDIKTARDASPFGVSRAAGEYGWHVQVAHYMTGLEAVAPIPLGVPYRRFLHLVVESSPPYCSAVYELDDVGLEKGTETRNRYIAQWVHCKKTSEWPGYSSEAEHFGLPRWMAREE